MEVAGIPPATEKAPAAEVEVADANIDAAVRDEDPYADALVADRVFEYLIKDPVAEASVDPLGETRV